MRKKTWRVFRLFTSQLIVQGVVQQCDIVRVFGVPRITVTRAVKLYREQGPKGFFRRRRVRSGGVLKGETIAKRRRCWRPARACR